MGSYLSENITYNQPLDYFLSLPEYKHVAFLHSSVKQHYAGKYSIIGLFPHQVETFKTFDELNEHITIDECIQSNYFSGGWIVTLSYDLKNTIEDLVEETNRVINQPNITCILFGAYLFFNNDTKECVASFKNNSYKNMFNNIEYRTPKTSQYRCEYVKSNFDKKCYLNAIQNVKNYIYEGDIFEANLTRKFYGKLEQDVSGKQIFSDLVHKSPSQYSAYIKYDDLEIISSSPERFIKIKNSEINSKPIKGTRARGNSSVEDNTIINDLRNATKDRAENLMIVDLVRNDIGRIAKIGSVSVPDLFKVETYETVHQLVSTVTGELASGNSVVDAIKSCFPPGSMTGAPKIRAMDICAEIEDYKRGIYSGAIGYIGFDGYVDLSVVIRTIIKKGKKFEFQVGGAIVSDSDPIEEYQETLDKAKAICSVLNIDISNI